MGMEGEIRKARITMTSVAVDSEPATYFVGARFMGETNDDYQGSGPSEVAAYRELIRDLYRDVRELGDQLATQGQG